MKPIKLIVSFFILLLSTQAVADKVTVAAASDLKFALEEVAALFEQQTNVKLRLVFGSSGNFKTQILQGAPFDIFMSADENFVFELDKADKTQNQGQLYAIGRIGIFIPHHSPLQADGEFIDLISTLKAGRLTKFAIANPAHAPYGSRAKEALQHAGIWEALQPHLVFGENISQTAQFATSGSTQGGIIALSLATAPQVAKLGHFELIPDKWHKPLLQRMVLLKNASLSAQQFYDFLATPSAQAIMMRYGFAMPFPSS